MQKTKARSLILFFFIFGILLTICAFIAGLLGAFIGVRNFTSAGGTITEEKTVSVVNEESAIIEVAETKSPSVVSVIISQDVPIYENFRYDPFDDEFFNDFFRRRQIGTEERQVGAGTGFIISRDGMIITNRHVVAEEDANYTVILNDGTQVEAEVMARDSILDIAVLNISTEQELQPLQLGDSSNLQIGQSVIAIGNSLGEFSNTVSSGIISGLSRSIIASGQSGAERLSGVIQTDASINQGNSGGPLLDIEGNVIGVNVAVAARAENIGFAIPIDDVVPIIESVEEFGEIRRPQMGVRYLPVTEELAEQRDLPVNYGALLSGGNSGANPILPDGPADRAGLIGGDIIIAINGNRIDSDNQLQQEILNYDVGETVEVSFIRDGQNQTTRVTLESR